MRLVRDAAADADLLAAVSESAYAPLVRGRLRVSTPGTVS
jgi:hypothetical protein